MISSNKTLNYLLWLGIIASTSALTIYAYLGFFTRYMADDYCLLADLQSDNLFTASWNKYLFSSNRYTNLFILSLWEIFPKNIAFVPALHIILWVVGLFWLMVEINRLFNLQLKALILVLFTELLVLFTFYTAPNIFQVLYWRPGQVTYLTPLVLFAFLAVWLVRMIRSQSEKNLIFYVPLFAFLAFFIGGLSETIGIFHLGILSLAIVIVFFYDTSPRQKIALTLLIALLLGGLISLLAMFLAPANALRINPETSPPTILMVISRSIQYTYDFLLAAFNTMPVPYVALIGISILLSFLFFAELKMGKWNPRFVWVFLLIPLITYGFIFITFAPSAYGQSYPVERVRFPAHFILNIALMVLSIYIGYILSYIKLPSFTKHIAFALAFLVLLYPFWMARVPLQTYEYRQLWAQRWDERETMIYTAINNGETDIFVPGLDGYEGAKELEIYATFWTNQCAAEYYGVNTLTIFQVEEENVLDFFSE